MRDRTEEAERSEVMPAPRREAPLAKVQAVPWLIVIALLALAGWLAFEAFGPDEMGDPIATGLAALEEQNELVVFSAEMAPVVSSRDSRLFGALESRQIAVIPARVEYRVDMGAIDASRMGWDGESETLSVRLPPLDIGKINLDEGRAQYLREGLWIGRDAQDKLTRSNTATAEKEARRRARDPVLLKLAREAAISAMRQNLAGPMRAAGFDDVEIDVRFDGNPEP